MKSALFFFVSMALHAAALAYPALFLELKAGNPVKVTILDAGGEGDGGGAEVEENALERKPVLAPSKASSIKGQRPPATEPQQTEAPKAVSTPVMSSAADGGAVLAADSIEPFGPAESSSLASGVASWAHSGADAGETSETIGSGSGRGGTGLGSGNQYGNGNKATFVQPRYAHCPKPDYPQRATREGWEGTVLLRVLVDEEGKPKSVELYRSSGFAILDQAAIDNVKRRCRFHPARDGEKRMEQWTRVPVEFAVRNSRN